MSGIGKEITTTYWRWGRTVDLASLVAVIFLMISGGFLIYGASPAVAHRIGASQATHFIFKQVFFLALSFLSIIGISVFPKRSLLKIALIIGGISLLATVGTLVHGLDIKGARRWIGLGFMSIQPSEFLKPCLALVAAWLLTQPHNPESKLKPSAYYLLLGLLYAFIAFLLLAQPDFGMLVVITAIIVIQIILAGFPIRFLAFLGIASVPVIFAAYYFLPHVHSRIDSFLFSNGGDHYQIQMALKAFANAGLYGRGPGAGHFKDLIPDAHADFIFAVGAEESGIFFSLGIIGVFAWIALRSLNRLSQKNDLFSMIAGSGLVAAFALQAFINMASTMHLIPTKGMTLPFMSYGGSSALAMGLTMGLLLGLTRNTLPHDVINRS